jgi:hypothetical protein
MIHLFQIENLLARMYLLTTASYINSADRDCCSGKHLVFGKCNSRDEPDMAPAPWQLNPKNKFILLWTN